MLKESAEINYKPFAVNAKKYYWIYAVVATLVIWRVWLFVGDISEMNSQFDSYQNYDDYEMQWIGDFNPKMMNVAASLGTHISRRLVTYRYNFDRTKAFHRHPIV